MVGGGLASSAQHHQGDGPASSLGRLGMGTEQCAVVISSVVSLHQGGLASSAWHIDQMGQPPRLGCLGMCTGQCAVVDVSSKCWRSMLVLDM